MNVDDREVFEAWFGVKISCWHCMDSGRTFFIIGKDSRSEYPRCEHCGRTPATANQINELAQKLSDQ